MLLFVGNGFLNVVCLYCRRVVPTKEKAAASIILVDIFMLDKAAFLVVVDNDALTTYCTEQSNNTPNERKKGNRCSCVIDFMSCVFVLLQSFWKLRRILGRNNMITDYIEVLCSSIILLEF
mmetsp:Transcript_26909/g.39974  ORF Transcript_26909/g.39974 Transcript_26909/m.39974 type:complete len:121 (+) Transcript_26909:784-1146(+)